MVEWTVAWTVAKMVVKMVVKMVGLKAEKMVKHLEMTQVDYLVVRMDTEKVVTMAVMMVLYLASA